MRRHGRPCFLGSLFNYCYPGPSACGRGVRAAIDDTVSGGSAGAGGAGSVFQKALSCCVLQYLVTLIPSLIPPYARLVYAKWSLSSFYLKSTIQERNFLPSQARPRSGARADYCSHISIRSPFSFADSQPSPPSPE